MPQALRFLLRRPIAVLMSFAVLVMFSLLALRELPVSLLPSVAVPELYVRVNWPNASPAGLEASALRPLRENMATLRYLQSLESSSGSETGLLKMRFEYGAPMDLLFIEVNERLDRLMGSLPPDLPRPQPIRLSTGDLPVVRLQVVPAEGQSVAECSELAEKVLRKRLEALPGIALVDLNGLQGEELTVIPKKGQLTALGLSESDLTQVLAAANLQLGALSVKDGQYRYFLQIRADAYTPEALMALPVNLPNQGGSVPLGKLAEVRRRPGEPLGYHLFQNGPAVLITLHKQESARMSELRGRIETAVAQFRTDFPQMGFHLTQDQSALLQLSIGNLLSSLLFGGAFAFAVLFLFFGNYRLPLLIGISLPSSLLISFLVFGATGLSINIISLSGLALGLGMLIDNAIIVMDNISRRLEKLIAEGGEGGEKLLQACVEGTSEVMAPLISSVLTTLAVFVPLVFAGGISGALFYDQALSVAATLGASLLVAFVLIPLLYRLFFYGKMGRKVAGAGKGRIFRENRLYLWVQGLWRKGHGLALSHSWAVAVFFLLMVPLGTWVATELPVQGLPKLSRSASELRVDWNEPLEASENLRRCKQLLQQLEGTLQLSEADVGVNQFVAQWQPSKASQTVFYLLFPDPEARLMGERQLVQWLESNFPAAMYGLSPPPDAFGQVFGQSSTPFEIRVGNRLQEAPLSAEQRQRAEAFFASPRFIQGEGLATETVVELQPDAEALSRYGISLDVLYKRLEMLFSDYTITELRDFGEAVPLRLQAQQHDFISLLERNTLRMTATEEGDLGGEVPLSALINVRYRQGYRQLTGDRSGVYHAFIPTQNTGYHQLMQEAKQWAAAQPDMDVRFGGSWERDREQLYRLLLIFVTSLLLLYFILAAQFESLLQPLVVMLTLPAGICGSLLALWLGGGSLNVMSGIGLVVMLGIVVNDSILKVDTLNRLRRAGLPMHQVLEQAGAMRLKPILMTTITTILALSPILFFSGLGAELQRPLVLSVTGGLLLGTLAALFLLPLLYRWMVGGKA